MSLLLKYVNRIVARKPARRTGRQRGFMLVESMVSIAIVGTGILAAVTSISTSSQATIKAREGATAAWVATSQIELIKGSPFVAAPGTYPTVTPPPGFTVQNSTTAFPGGNVFIQDVTVQVFKSGNLISTFEMIKIDN